MALWQVRTMLDHVKGTYASLLDLLSNGVPLPSAEKNGERAFPGVRKTTCCGVS